MTSRSAGGWRSAQVRSARLRLRLEAETHYGKSVLFLPQISNLKPSYIDYLFEDMSTDGRPKSTLHHEIHLNLKEIAQVVFQR